MKLKNMKKFTFGFLDRFKKSKSVEPENLNPNKTYTELIINNVTKLPDIKHNELNNIEVNKIEDELISDLPAEPTASHSIYESKESPEEFAEKTLGDFNLNKYQQQLQESALENKINNEAQTVTEAPDKFNFEEMKFSNPEEKKKKKFSFPKLDSLEITKKFKNTLSGKSAIKSLDKFSWNDFVLRVFSPYTRGKVHGGFIILLVFVVTYMLGKTFALFISSSPPVTKSARSTISIPLERADTTIQDLNKITATNLFNAKDSDKSADLVTAKKDIDSIICLDADRPTSLQIKLLDTIVLQDSVKSVASVQIRGSSELTNVREGEKVDQMAEISKINRMKLILKNLQTGDCEYAATDAEPETPMPNLNIISAKAGKSLFKSSNPNIKNSGNSFKIKRAFRDSMITNMSDVLTQAKAVQITNPDGSLCFKMTEVVAGSLYSQLNIQENDIICNINGKKIENLNELMGLLGRIKEIDQFQIGLTRNGMSENLDYGFE
jgi:type II secretory pathway component PulC